MATAQIYPSAWATTLIYESGYYYWNWQTDSPSADKDAIVDGGSSSNIIAYRYDLKNSAGKKLKCSIGSITCAIYRVTPSSNIKGGKLLLSREGEPHPTDGVIGLYEETIYPYSSSIQFSDVTGGIFDGTLVLVFSTAEMQYSSPYHGTLTFNSPRITFDYQVFPDVTPNSPEDSAKIESGQDILFSWSLSSGTQKSAVVEVSENSTFSTIRWSQTINNSSTSATYSGTVLEAGKSYYWRVRVTTTTNLDSVSDVQSFTIAHYIRITSPANGASFTEGDSITIRWETSVDQRQRIVERSTNGGSTWVTILSQRNSSKSYTDTSPPTGAVAYRVSAGVSTSEMIASKTITVTVNAMPTPSITPVQPWGDVIYADQAILFSWNVSNATQASAYLYYSTNGGSTWTLLTSLSSSTQYPASANTFSAGQIYWKVSVTDTNGKSAESSPVSFTVMEPYVPPTPDDPPTVGSVSVSPINSGLDADFASTAIAGISRCRVQASVSKGTNNISRVYLTYPEYSGSIAMTLSGGYYVGETTLALSQSTTFTVTAVDTEGYYDSDTTSISVEPYAAPTIRVNTLIRCDASGAEDGSGTYFLINAAASCSSVDGKNYIVSNSFTARVKNSSNYVQVTNNENTRSNVGELVNEDAVYVIVVAVTDHVGSTSSVEIGLAGKLRDVVFKRDTTHNTAHVGIGMSPAGGDETSIQLPPGGKIIIGGQDITAWLRSQIGGSW